MSSNSNSSIPRSRHCTVCGDQLKDTRTIVIEHSPVCSKCIQQLFDLSLTNESNFPPRWGNVILDPKDFRHVLRESFLTRYTKRENEWRCPPTDRIYCHGKTSKNEICGRFLGCRSEMKTRMEYVGCKRCWWLTCLQCLEVLNLGEDPEDGSEDGCVELAHVCPGVKEEPNPFEGLKLGKDYQLCPNEDCRRPAELAAGCNHIACLCGTNYCFVCAVPAEELSDHWKVGGCPRYGQPGSSSALYNDHVRLAGDDAGSDVEDDDLVRWQMQTLREQEGLQSLERRPSRSRVGGAWYGGRSVQGPSSRLHEPNRRSRASRRASPSGRSELGNRTEVTGGRLVTGQSRATAQPGPRPKRGLRQIISERGQVLIEKFL